MADEATTLESPASPSPALRFVRLGFSSCGRVQLSWTIAGGIAGGGFFVAVLALLGQVSPSFAPQLTAIFFLAGALAGVVHGALLGYLGREACRGRVTTLQALLAALPWVLPGLVLGWVTSTWITLLPTFLSSPGLVMGLGVALGWAVGLAICGWAVLEGYRALRRACTRWAEARVGLLITSGVFLVLAVTFVAERPEIWWTDFRVTGIGAVILALGATVWLALPTVVTVLYAARKIREGLLVLVD